MSRERVDWRNDVMRRSVAKLLRIGRYNTCFSFDFGDIIIV